MFVCYLQPLQWAGWEHLDSDLCHQRAQNDAAHEYRSSSFFYFFCGCGGTESCTARWLRLPPLCSALSCGWGRWRCLKTGIRLVLWRCQPKLHSSASVIEREEKAALKRAEQKPGNSYDLCLILCDEEGERFLASPGIWIHKNTECGSFCAAAPHSSGYSASVWVDMNYFSLKQTYTNSTLLIKPPVETTLTQKSWWQSFSLPTQTLLSTSLLWVASRGQDNRQAKHNHVEAVISMCCSNWKNW